MTTQNQNILVICGPTASGKTSLALKIAGLLPRCNLLSVDSRQIYQDLDLITGKDIPADLSPNIKFYGLNLVSPNQIFNVSDFTNYSQKVIADSLAQNIPLIIVGGTGLYLQAITSNLLTVHIPPNSVLRNELEKLDLPSLKKRLRELNPVKFNSLNNSDVNNPRRLIRAIEITSSNQSPSANFTEIPTHSFVWIGLSQDKELQKENIQKRVQARLKEGAVQEVQSLLKKYRNSKLSIFSSLGVKQILEFLDQKITKEELINLWTLAENDYARRQMVWFRKQPGIIWYDRSKINQLLVEKLAKVITKND